MPRQKVGATESGSLESADTLESNSSQNLNEAISEEISDAKDAVVGAMDENESLTILIIVIMRRPKLLRNTMQPQEAMQRKYPQFMRMQLVQQPMTQMKLQMLQKKVLL